MPGPIDRIADGGTATVNESSCELADVSERYAALAQALQAGIDLPPELLRHASVSDPSESVRLLAFTTYVDSVSHDRSDVRDALEIGLYDGGPAIQAEAQRRLAELEQYERALSEPPPQGLR